MVRKEELRFVANELEQVSESLAELTDAIDVYQKKDESHRNIYSRVLHLRSEAFALFDQIATLAEKEEEVKEQEPNDTAKRFRESMERAGVRIENLMRKDAIVFPSSIKRIIKEELGYDLEGYPTDLCGFVNREES